MARRIMAMREDRRVAALDLVEAVFTAHENAQEGNPQNYRSRGFVTSQPFGITAHESVGLPAPECLMVKELVPGGLAGIRGQVSYQDYETLR